MSILIKGMEMPKDKAVSLIICSSGNVYYDHLEFAGEAVRVPPHGRLIDAETLYKAVEGSRNVNPHKKDDFKRAHDFEHSHFLSLIARQKTIIEAEEERHDERRSAPMSSKTER